MILEINKNYRLYTRQNTISGENVRVVSIRGYDDLKSIPFDVHVLATNEKIVSEDDDLNPLQNKIFFHCVTLDGNNTHIVVWNEVIDFNRTTVLDTEYGYLTTITISETADTNLQYVLDDMRNVIEEKYQGSVKLAFIQQFIGAKSEDQKMHEKIVRYEDMLEKLLLLRSIIPRIERVSDIDFNKIFTEINENLGTIKEDINFIQNTL